MKLLEALQWRYAVKKMNGTKIPAEKLETIIEATRLAPSAFGLTPYSIIVVEDEETRKKLQPAFYNQSQVVDGSVVIVFAAWNTISEKEIAEYMQEIAEQRGVAVDTLKDFSAAISGSFKNKTPEQARVWADKQAYLALGFSLVAAAAEYVADGAARQASWALSGSKNPPAWEIKGSVVKQVNYQDSVRKAYREAFQESYA